MPRKALRVRLVPPGKDTKAQRTGVCGGAQETVTKGTLAEQKEETVSGDQLVLPRPGQNKQAGEREETACHRHTDDSRRARLRPGREAAEVEGFGLEEASLAGGFKSLPAQVAQGLSGRMNGAKLLSRLGCGPLALLHPQRHYF